MTKHTSPPYHANGLDVGVAVHGRTGLHVVATCSPLDACASKGLANAEFICRAVNCHDELLKWAKEYRRDCFNKAIRNDPSGDWTAFILELDELISKATPPVAEASAGR